MKIQYKNINDRSEFFLAPIPRWITHYGFILMLLVSFILVFFSFVIKYPETKSVTVFITKDNVFSLIDFSTYEKLTPNQSIYIDLPLVGRLNAKIDQNSAQLSHNFVLNKLDINPNKYKGLISDTVYCKGEITLSNFTLMERILNK